MISSTSEKFWKGFERLPDHVQKRAREAYKLWRENPEHPSLQFKQIHSKDAIYSVRIGIGWRALGVRESDTIIWFWIGPHSEYDKLISKMRTKK